jgi:hypothetical protein
MATLLFTESKNTEYKPAVEKMQDPIRSSMEIFTKNDPEVAANLNSVGTLISDLGLSKYD